MSNPKWDEQIIAVKREDLFDGEEDVFQGVLTDEDKLEELALRFETFDVIRRGHKDDPAPVDNNAEIDFSYKQTIPYVIVKREDQIFAYKRLSGSGESRLVDKISIGIGGHMNAVEDLDTFGEHLVENLIREIDEELDVQAEGIKLTTLGLINDDSDEVGKVHIGVLMLAELEAKDNVKVREKDQLEGEWMTVEQLNEPETYSKLENWTKLALTVL